MEKIRIFQKGFNYSQDGQGNRCLLYTSCQCSSVIQHDQNLDFILQMMIMLNYRGTLTDEECMISCSYSSSTPPRT